MLGAQGRGDFMLWKSSGREKGSEALPVYAVVPSETSSPSVLIHLGGGEASWFAVYTHARHEKCVARHLRERCLENFLPLYQKVHHWRKRSRVTLDLPFFPNYVFVRIKPEQRASVLAVPGVVALVGRGHIPSPLPDSEIESLRIGLELGKCEPHPYLVAGERVRIRTGAMEGFEGILLRRKNDVRVVLTLELIQRSVAVEVDAEDVEPVAGPRTAGCTAGRLL